MEWISVKERLPEEEWKKYLALYNDDGLEIICMIAGAKIATSLYYDGTGFRDCFFDYLPVTHWMYLPEPPEEVS